MCTVSCVVDSKYVYILSETMCTDIGVVDSKYVYILS